MTRKLMIVLGLALGPVFLLLTDVIFSRTGPGDVFETLFEFVRSTAVVAWPIGVLIGHWYYPGERSPVIRRPINYIVLGIVSLLVMGLSLLFLAVPGASNVVSAVAFCGGIVTGVLLWSMDNPPATH